MAGESERTKFVIGLGNPGRRYAKTRHNVGWMVTGALQKRWGLGKGRKEFGGLLYDARGVSPEGKYRDAMLFEPLTYMNRSGEAVKGLATYFKVQPDSLLVVLDDMAIRLGWTRARAGGSDGGHNGLGDILRLLNMQDVPRLRIGIGRPPSGAEDIEYVLSPFSGQQLKTVEMAVAKTADAVEDWLAFGIGYVMDKYNCKADQLTETDNGSEK